MGEKSSKNTELWSGVDHIPELFETYHPEFIGKALMGYLNQSPRVVVKSDPALVKVFGQETVDRYEAMLAEQDR